jgi:hypothetical protein
MMKPKALINTPKIMILVIWDVDGPALVEIVPPNLCVSTKYLCEFAIPHMEANVKTHRPKQGLKDITFHCDNGIMLQVTQQKSHLSKSTNWE